MIFENLKNIKKVGKFGNSNAEFMADWIDIELDSIQSYTSPPRQFDESNRGCNFGSSMTIDFYFGKINTRNNPQYEILRAVRTENLNDWTFKGANPEDKETFQAIATINFIEVEQDPFLWVPPVTRAYIPRNSLYPFRTYLAAG